MRSAWLLLVIVMFTTLVAAALLGALASFSSQVMPQAVHARLAKSPGRAITAIGLVSPRVASTDTAAIRHQLRSALGDVPFRMDTAIWSPPLALTAPAGRSANKAEVATMSRIRTHAHLVSGSWPKPARVGRPVTVAVPAAVAHQLHLQPGSAMAARDPDSGTRRKLKVTGVYRQRDPTSGYWNLDAIWACGATSEGCFTRSGPIVAAGSVFTTTALPATQASWVVVPQTRHIETGALDTLAGQVGRVAERLQSPALGGLVVSTGLPELLQATSRHLTAARTLVAAAGLQLILPTLAVLALAARLLAAHRADEAALLGARGASARQLARPSLAEALLTGTASVVLGTLAALGLTDLLANVALPADASIGPATMTTALWLTEAGTLALCVLVMVWPAFRLRAPDAVPGRRTRRAAAAAAVTGADLMLVALAALAVWQLREHPAGTPLPAGHIGVDPLLAITPVLALAAVSLVPVRVLPALTRVADRVTDAARRLGPALAGWTLSRRAAHQAGPVLLAVFVVATGTLAFAGHQSWRRSAQDRAAFTTGADVRVDASTPVPLRDVHALTQASGVTHAMAVAATSTGAGAELLALDAHAAPATVLLRPDLSPLPTRRLWQRVSPGARKPGIALPGHPARLRVMASLAPGAAAKVSGASATATVQDASGAVYVLSAGTLPVDGRRHRLAAVLAPNGRADDPLRLLGLSFTYLLPPFPGPPGGGADEAGPAGDRRPRGLTVVCRSGRRNLRRRDRHARVAARGDGPSFRRRRVRAHRTDAALLATRRPELPAAGPLAGPPAATGHRGWAEGAIGVHRDRLGQRTGTRGGRPGDRHPRPPAAAAPGRWREDLAVGRRRIGSGEDRRSGQPLPHGHRSRRRADRRPGHPAGHTCQPRRATPASDVVVAADQRQRPLVEAPISAPGWRHGHHQLRSDRSPSR
jgi:hypothetical protein